MTLDADGLDIGEVQPLESYETVCSGCQLAYNRNLLDCPNCVAWRGFLSEARGV